MHSGLHSAMWSSSHAGDEGWTCLKQERNFNEPIKVRSITSSYLNSDKVHNLTISIIHIYLS